MQHWLDRVGLQQTEKEEEEEEESIVFRVFGTFNHTFFFSYVFKATLQKSKYNCSWHANQFDALNITDPITRYDNVIVVIANAVSATRL